MRRTVMHSDVREHAKNGPKKQFFKKRATYFKMRKNRYIKKDVFFGKQSLCD